MGSIQNVFNISLGSVTDGFELAANTISALFAEGFGSLSGAAE